MKSYLFFKVLFALATFSVFGLFLLTLYLEMPYRYNPTEVRRKITNNSTDFYDLLVVTTPDNRIFVVKDKSTIDKFRVAVANEDEPDSDFLPKRKDQYTFEFMDSTMKPLSNLHFDILGG